MQAGLGNQEGNRHPIFSTSKIAKVTSNKDYSKLSRIEVIAIDYSTVFPVWVVGDIERVPEEGDMVIIGFIEGRRDAPYLMGFVKDAYATSGYFSISKSEIRLSLNSVSGSRGNARIVLNQDGIYMYHPQGVTVADESAVKRIATT